MPSSATKKKRPSWALGAFGRGFFSHWWVCVGVSFVPFVPSVSVRLEQQPMTRERGQIKPLSRWSHLVFLKETDGIETDGI